jgi:hypothetical protein
MVSILKVELHMIAHPHRAAGNDLFNGITQPPSIPIPTLGSRDNPEPGDLYLARPEMAVQS